MKRKVNKRWLRKKNMWPFAPSQPTRQRTPARGGIAAHTKSGKKPTSAGAQYKGYSIRLLEDGSYVIPKIDPDTQFEDLKQAKRFVDSETKARRNPSDAYRAGVAAMKSAAARHGTTNLTPSIAQREEWRHAWGDFMKGDPKSGG